MNDPDRKESVGVEADSNETEDETTSPQGLAPSLLVVRQRGYFRDLMVLLMVLTVVIAVTTLAAQLLGGSLQRNKALSAGAVSLLAMALAGGVMLRPTNDLNFIGLVYLATLIRMGLGLGAVLIMRQIDTPLFGKDWVGYILAFYGVGLLLETISAARSIKA